MTPRRLPRTVLCAAAFMFFAGSAAYSAPRQGSEHTLFLDDFGEESRGTKVRNIVSDPPPHGLGYETDTPFGFLPVRWLIVDRDAGAAKRGFWCIPIRPDGVAETFMRQAGRSRNSIAYASVPVPAGTARYRIEFHQWCHDNDYIGYIIGASEPALEHDGVEFGYEREQPGTNRTVDDFQQIDK